MVTLIGAYTVPAHAEVERAPSKAAGELTRIGRTVARARIDLTFLLRVPGSAALERYLAERTASAPPLTPAEIGERFGLPSARLDRLTAQLERAGIRVTERFDQRSALLATGRARAVERLFGVRLIEVRDKDGDRFRIPDHPLRIPPELRDAVVRVGGLDTRPAYQPSAVTPPSQLRDAYQANTLAQDGYDGSGETVAVVSLATAHGEEFAAWAKRFETSVEPFENITVKPRPPKPTSSKWKYQWTGEIGIDLGMVRALAPAATILNYETRNDGTSIERALGQLIQDRRASIVTISWGSCELDDNADYMARVDETTYAMAEAAGIDIFVASGDHGPYDCQTWDGPPDRRISVDFPSSSAHVIAVGGTTLYIEDRLYQQEAWQESASVTGAGGGVSTVIARPPWQLNSVVNDPGTKRLVPDVAGPASAFTNLLIPWWNVDHLEYRLA
ncbi:MAG: hypothetical protein E6G60_04100, partial [Actinobacteria bacterium]